MKRWIEAMSVSRPSQLTGVLTVRRATDGATISAWTVRDVIPTKWNVSGFDAGGSKVALEALELTHRGFLER